MAVLLWTLAGDLSGPGVRATPAGPGGYEIDAGPWKVASQDLVLRDERRQKDLGILVRYPVVAPGEPRRFPLVVFSHGAGGSRWALPDLTAHWASPGYIVVLPTHPDLLMLRQAGDLASFKRDLDSLIRDVKPLDRLADVVFLLDSIGIIQDRIKGLRDQDGDGRVDRDRIGETSATRVRTSTTRNGGLVSSEPAAACRAAVKPVGRRQPDRRCP